MYKRQDAGGDGAPPPPASIAELEWRLADVDPLVNDTLAVANLEAEWALLALWALATQLALAPLLALLAGAARARLHVDERLARCRRAVAPLARARVVVAADGGCGAGLGGALIGADGAGVGGDGPVRPEHLAIIARLAVVTNCALVAFTLDTPWLAHSPGATRVGFFAGAQYALLSLIHI